jgi:ABC-type cobalamin/Fe3+-siderophores transport system ATPase subunit
MWKLSQQASSKPPAGPAIDLDGVDFGVNGTSILRDLNLSVVNGEFVLILGPNGAGKTTLLKLIDGLLVPSRGTVSLMGTPLLDRTVKPLRRRVAYLAQDLAVDTRIPITVSEVVGIGRLAHKALIARLSDSDREIVDRAVKTVGIGHLGRRPFGQLSAGQKQKVSLARALAQEADIMLLDEPLSNLDPRAQVEVCRTIDRIHTETGKTVLLVTHLLDTIPESASRVVLMREGTFVGEASVDRIRDDDFRQAFYSGLAEGALKKGPAGKISW